VAYRVLPTGEPQVTLLNRGTTYWMRVFAHLRAGLTVLLWVMPMASVFVLLVAGLFAAFEQEAYVYELARISSYFALPPLALVGLGSLVAAIGRSPHEALLPHRLVLRERSIDVYTSNGATLDERWTYIVDAAETAAAFVLVLRREPLLRLVVAKRRLSAAERERVGRWLRQNGCLRT
jgi:hypothetical protein